MAENFVSALDDFGADVRIAFDVPQASRSDLHRAVWYRHHLPHNIDRALGQPDRRKSQLFNVKDPVAFTELHRINEALVAAHPRLISSAQQSVAEARIGVANAAVAGKRDWSFALYPSEQLETLRQAIYSKIRT